MIVSGCQLHDSLLLRRVPLLRRLSPLASVRAVLGLHRWAILKATRGVITRFTSGRRERVLIRFCVVVSAHMCAHGTDKVSITIDSPPLFLLDGVDSLRLGNKENTGMSNRY
jgi:hypothetical protein